ncbi:7TM domain-containing protein [Halobacteriovorax sp. HLS]|uniref:7TM domain-containing protein n=1 Tax=Halobacteriovorax sp. HLS TaxID=2234000 RepID=UPI000FD96CAE|nr:7TM domain-containing protein [Halobacteriovorax sp. HLS]
MSRTKIKSIGLVLFLIGIFSVIYKIYVLDMPLTPQANYDKWTIEYSVELTRDRDKVDVLVPKIFTRDYQLVSSDKEVLKEAYSGDLKKGIIFKKKYEISFKKKNKASGKPTSFDTFTEDEEDKESITKIYNILIKANPDNLSFAKNVGHYIHAEMGTSKKDVGSFEKVLLTETASLKEKALLYHFLMLRKGVSSKILLGIDLNSKELRNVNSSVEASVSFVNQVYINDKWISIGFDLEEGIFNPNRFIIVTDNFVKYRSLFEHDSINVSFLVKPGTVSGVNGVSYNKDLKQKSAFYSSFNLYQFPLAMQKFYFYILIIPFGTLVLAVCRNMIGIKTFGIFMPILLGLFLASSSFWMGLFTLFLVVLLGLVERYVLDKFYLLAVPRLSIILTLIVGLFLFMGVMNFNFDLFNPQMFSGVPIVILAVFVETLSVQLLEEGFKKSLPPILGTLFIAVLSYFLYQFLFVKIVLFTHPELLISVIGLLILIGSYHGYRISELIRFKSFIEDK